MNERSHQKPETVIPVVEEQLKTGKRKTETGVTRIRMIIREQVETVDEPLVQDVVDVRRVPVNRFVESRPEEREQNGTMIVPVLEEVLVVEKKLLLREELHITKKKTMERKPRQVTLRKEEALVEHNPATATRRRSSAGGGAGGTGGKK